MEKRQYIKTLRWPVLIILLIIIVGGSIGARSPSSSKLKTRADRTPSALLIDDFSNDRSIQKADTGWEFISDRVMGGLSVGRIEYGMMDDRSCLHLVGSVVLQNNGGFIQARGTLGPKGRNFNAHAYKGIKLFIKGNHEPYAVHLRTRDTRMPWQYYESVFPTNGEWQEIQVPFTQFKPVSLRSPLNTKALTTLAVVAKGKRFDADILVDHIAFYKDTNMVKKLTPEEERVILHKGTERPFSGQYVNHFEDGTYTCKQCGATLFDSSSKFHSNCGWPSFDDQIKGTVKMQPDADGVRTEIVCANCGGHLGHVFKGERLTPKNTRYCVNSISLDFVPEGQPVQCAWPSLTGGRLTAEQSQNVSEQESKVKKERAIFASGCFWGTEYHLQKVPGVLSTTVGYTGGQVDHPTYKQVCTDKTGHAEAVEVIYDPSKTNYETLARLFFETHDFTQLNRQGPDIGKQYRSAIFYLNDEQKETAAKLIEILKKKGYDVKTELAPASKFWRAELYHQDYYKNNGNTPYCHIYRKIF
ncbi:MAG: bifunctional methionine sulfoxide reductase B/A protein [Sedimentisphaerales bacterium]|nr:bifunctional methionine sulfoxide reductase B/A protein [Sedimentisphaerales bacterium]